MRKILVYADSRGQFKGNKSDYKTYVDLLKNKYQVHEILKPKKWTTLIDFLGAIEKKEIFPENYDAVILHVGVSDFSPRCQKEAQDVIYQEKKEMMDKLFGESNIKYYLMSDLDCTYRNDKTINLYSMDMLLKNIIPELRKIRNLLWISCNRIAQGWNGNYPGVRPNNISYIQRYSELMEEKLDCTVSLHSWSDREIMSYTCDNMHLTKKGNQIVFEMIERHLGNIFNNKDKDKDKDDALIIMGNGPSLRDVDFDLLRDKKTFGLNVAYKKYKDLNFYPTYFGCFDFIVTEHHADKFLELIENSPIEKYFFARKDFIVKKMESKNHGKPNKSPININKSPININKSPININKSPININKSPININEEDQLKINDEDQLKINEEDQLKIKKKIVDLHFVYPYQENKNPSFEYFVDMGSSGANATLAGILLGFKKIILLGCDANYQNFVKGSKLLKDGSMVIDETPDKNPNYWFDTYQEKGDVYNYPDSQHHLGHWKRVSRIAKKKGVTIVNCSPISKITFFRKSTLAEEI
jgi:lysophospholipase L1-like esterase